MALAKERRDAKARTRVIDGEGKGGAQGKAQQVTKGGKGLLAAVAVLLALAVAGVTQTDIWGSKDTDMGLWCNGERLPGDLLWSLEAKMQERPVGMWVATKEMGERLRRRAEEVQEELEACGLASGGLIAVQGEDAEEVRAGVVRLLARRGGSVVVQLSDEVLEAGLRPFIEGALDDSMPVAAHAGKQVPSGDLVVVVYSTVSLQAEEAATVSMLRASKQGVWEDRLVQRFASVVVL